MTHLHKFEAVDGALGSLLRHGDFMICADPRGYIRASNILFDACIGAGMSHNEPDHELWALEFVSRKLLAA